MLRAYAILMLFLAIPSIEANASHGPCPLDEELQSIFGGEPEELKPDATVKIEKDEISSFGKVLGPGESLASLPDGRYLYLIAHPDVVIYSPRVPDITAEKFLVSHRSLAKKYQELFGHHPKVVASGEFHINNGRVTEINNRSGTFRGKAARVKYAEAVMKRRGLKVEERTIRADYSDPEVSGKIHQEEEEDASAQVFLMKNPRTAKVVQEFDAFRKAMAEKYPGRAPGLVQWRDFYYATAKHGIKSGNNLAECNQIIDILNRTEKRTRKFKAFKDAYDLLGPEKFDHLPALLKQMEGYFAP